MQHRKAIFILLTAFLIAVCCRLPNLNRPLSKHHEFNTAVVLNNALSWQQAGGAAVYNYVPVMTYPGPTNRQPEPAVNTDDAGNQVYLSLGPGFFVLPYIIFNALHITATPLALQILNLFVHLLLLLAIYKLGHVIQTRFNLQSHFALYCSLAFLFMPGPLWYFGNGYIHTGVALPFAVVAFTLFLQHVFFQKKLNAAFILVFGSMGILSIYMDWFAFFLLGTIAAYSLYMYAATKAISWFKMACLSGLSAAAGVAIVFVQFASLVGWQKVGQYWHERSASRSFNMEDGSLASHFVSLAANIASCAGLTVLISAAVLILWFAKRKNTAYSGKIKWLVLLWGITCIAYNGLFFNWSFVHEFSMLPISVLLSVLTALFFVKILPLKYNTVFIFILIAVNLAQYYFINKPGNISRVGTPYNAQMLTGKTIAIKVPKDYRIFSNLVNDPVVEYYAHRSIYSVPTKKGAQQLCDSFHITKAVWLQCDSMKIKELDTIRPILEY